MNALTHHMVDDEKIETILNWEAAKQPMTGSKKAMEDAALEVYFAAYENGGPATAKKAWSEFWQNQNHQR